MHVDVIRKGPSEGDEQYSVNYRMFCPTIELFRTLHLLFHQSMARKRRAQYRAKGKARTQTRDVIMMMETRDDSSVITGTGELDYSSSARVIG